MTRRLLLTVVLGAAACADEASPTGDAETGAGSTSSAVEPATDDGSTGLPATTGGMFTATAFDSDESGADTTAGGTASLVYPGGNPLEVPFEELGGTRIIATELLNIGNAAATGLSPVDLVGPFAFTGDGYPGDLGNCTDTLDVGEMCLIHIAFTPVVLGPVVGEVNLGYDNGARAVASLALQTEARGVTPNLVPDGDAEACADGATPAGWDQGAVEHWSCSGSTGGVDPHDGESMLAVTVANDAPFSMTQRVDLTPHMGAIGEGQVSGALSLWTQTVDDDEVEITLHYLDAGQRVVASFEPAPSSSTAWTETTDTRLVPTTAVAADLTVRCLPQSGDCDAFVDAVSLTLAR